MRGFSVPSSDTFQDHAGSQLHEQRLDVNSSFLCPFPADFPRSPQIASYSPCNNPATRRILVLQPLLLYIQLLCLRLSLYLRVSGLEVILLVVIHTSSRPSSGMHVNYSRFFCGSFSFPSGLRSSVAVLRGWLVRTSHRRWW